MIRMLTVVALLAAALVGPLSAQCAEIANTGCPRTQAARCVTPPRLNTQFDVRCHPCSGRFADFVVVGTPAANPITLAGPVTCDGVRCVLGCNPLFVLFPEDRLSVPIPADPRLLGAQLCVQCGCLELTRPTCVTLAPAVRATVQN